MREATGNLITRVRTVAVPVSGQDVAVDFYCGTLGFEKRLDAPLGGGGRWIEVAPPGSDASLALVPAGGGLTAGGDTGIRLSTRDAEAEHALLSSRGVEVDAEILRWEGVPPMFSLRDLDGNSLVIVEEA